MNYKWLSDKNLIIFWSIGVYNEKFIVINNLSTKQDINRWDKTKLNLNLTQKLIY